jgi:branched-chain amino acid transport system substrate-binding protein
MKRIAQAFAVFVIFALLLTACAKQPTGNATEQQQTIKIGAIMPLTGSAASIGNAVQKTMELSAYDINSKGGINGKKLEIEYEDGGCNPKGGATAAQKLVGVDGRKVILGGFCSGETLGAVPITEPNKIILFSAGSSSPDITNAGDYVFRDYPSDAFSGAKLAEAAMINSDKSVAVISEQTDYSQAVRRVFEKRFQELGGKIAVNEPFKTDETDFRAALTKAKYANPDAVVIIGQTPASTARLVRQVREMGLKQQLYATDVIATEDIMKEYKDQLEGLVFAQPMIDENSLAYKQFSAEYTAKYGQPPTEIPPSYYASSYDAVQIVSEAMRKCGEDTDCIKQQLYAVKDRPGVMGNITIDQNGDAVIAFVLKTIKNGKVVEVQR